MESVFKIGGSYHSGMMEWTCCGTQVWQLVMWKGQPERRGWRPKCERCGEEGLSYKQLTEGKEKGHMAKDEQERRASMKLEDFVEGGGLIEGDLTWRNPRFAMYDYGGKAKAAPVFAVDLEPEGEGNAQTQYWSAGKAEDWAPSKSGKFLVRIGGAEKLSTQSNYYALLKSLVEGGFEGDPDEICDATDGMKAHMVRVPQPERVGLEKREGKRPATTLLVDKIISMPGEEKKKEGDELESEAMSLVMGILAENPKGLAKMKLASEIFKAGKAAGMALPKVNAINKLVAGASEDFLKAGGDGAWVFEKGTVKPT